MKKHFLLLALAAICSLSVGAVEYATSANFVEIMENYKDYKDWQNKINGEYASNELSAHHYSAGTTGMYFDYQPGLPDAGLGWDGWNTVSFNVKANSSVTITLGTTSGNYYGGTADISFDGGNNWETIYGSTGGTSGTPASTNYPISQDAQIIIRASSGWTRIHSITISDMSPKTVSFNTNGGTPETINPITETSFGAGITLPVAPTKSGYIFDGWYTAATGGTLAGAAGATYKPADNCTLYAHWAGFAEKANFYDAAMSSSQPDVATYLSDKHYTCSGSVYWDNQPTVYSDRGLGMDANRTLSFWVKANQKVTITTGTIVNYDGGTITLIQYDINGNQIGNPSYISANTTTNPYETNQVTEFRLTTQNVNDSWNRIHNINIEALAYTITFNPGEGSGEMDPEPKKENETYQLISPTPDYFTPPTGYHFKEWSCSYDSKSYAAGVNYTMPASDVTFTAIWEEDSDVEYAVTYANGGGTWVTEPTEGNHKAGETFALPASSVVSRTGYQFAGWNDGTTTFAAEATYTMPAKAVTLTALWNQLYTVTYNAGDVTYLGTLPTQEPQIASASFKVAAGIKCQGYAFKGWKAGATTYQPNDDFTMPASAVEFVAQWEAVTVPVITDLAVKSPDDNIVPLVWNIPGLVDMSKCTIPNPQQDNRTDLFGSKTDTKRTTFANGEVAVICDVPQFLNVGVAFPIPSTKNMETMSFEYKGSLDGQVSLYGGACEGTDFYFDMNNSAPAPKSNEWQSRTVTITNKCWTGDWQDIANKNFTQIAIMANSGGGDHEDQSFSVRNVRYHCTGMSDVLIDQVVVLRKENAPSANLTDGTEIYRGALSSFTDELNEATDKNKTFYYTVFALDADENASAGVSISYTYVVKEPHAVTYAKGAEDVTGDLPAAGSYKEDQEFALPQPGNLARSGYSFNGWSDGENTYQPGETYTMPDEAVEFTAQWKSYDHIPQVSTLDYSNLTATNSTLPFVSTDGGTCIDLTKGDTDPNLYADWKVFIKPGNYTVSYRLGANEYGWNVKLYLYDAANMSTPVMSVNDGTYRTGYATMVYNWDLTNLDENKLYIVRAENDYSGSHLRVHYINFEFVQSTPTAGFATASKNLVLNETFTQTVTTNSDGAVTYSSNNTNVATVDETTGKVTAVAKGTATITATIAETEAFKGATATYTVTVTKPMPTASFAITQKDLYVGDKFTQEVTTTSIGAVTYSSNNNAVTVNASTGEVTAVATGSATITANIAETETSEATSATYSITVMKSTGPIYLEPGENRIGAILNDLEDGDIIVFRDGEFTETTNRSLSKAVTFRADEGASPVLNCIYFQVTKGITVDGLTINSMTSEPLFRISGIGADMIFRNCTMHNNAYCFYQQGTIANFVMDNCVITSNSSIAVQLSSPATNISITNSTFINNGSNSLYLSGSATSVLIDHCTFYNNTQNTYTILATGSQTTISNSVFYNQNVGGGPAIYGNGTKPNVNNCIIKNWNTTTTNTNNTNLMTVDPQLVVDENGMYYRPNSPIVGAATDGTNLGDPRWKIYYITITDQDTDDALLESYNGKKANVEVIRPLVGGTTNSICLPFALNREQINTAFGEGAEVWALTSSLLSANNMTLDIEFETVENMEAGKPYLIQPGTGYDRDVNPIFYGVTVSTDLAPVEHANLDFIGTVQKSFVSVGFKDHLFVGANNMVFYPDASDYLNGMRAYFKIKYHPEAPVTDNVQARMILGRTTPTELQTLKTNDSVRKVMINGRIHIIRNGVTNDILGNTIK